MINVKKKSNMREPADDFAPVSALAGTDAVNQKFALHVLPSTVVPTVRSLAQGSTQHEMLLIDNSR